MSVGMKMSLFTLVAVLALAATAGPSQAQLYEGSNGWFAGGPIGYTAYRPLAVPTTAFYGGGCNTCATPVAVTAFRPGLFGWFRRPVTVVGFAPSCCGTSFAAPAIAAPACAGGCAAPSLASFAPAPSCCGGSTVTAAYAPTSFSAPPASSCCGGGSATTAYYSPTTTTPAATAYYQPAPTSVATPSPVAASNAVTPTPAAPTPTAAPNSVYATPQSLAPAAASSTEGNGSATAEPQTLKKEETTAPQFNAPLKPVPQGKTNIKGGLFQGPALVDPEDRTTQRHTGHFAVKQAVLLQSAKANTIRPSDAPASDLAPLDTEGWRPARAR